MQARRVFGLFNNLNRRTFHKSATFKPYGANDETVLNFLRKKFNYDETRVQRRFKEIKSDQDIGFYEYVEKQAIQSAHPAEPSESTPRGRAKGCSR